MPYFVRKSQAFSFTEVCAGRKTIDGMDKASNKTEKVGVFDNNEVCGFCGQTDIYLRC